MSGPCVQVLDWPLIVANQQVGVYRGHGTDASAAAGRISYLFGLVGPSISCNTACSSSLVALDAARQSLGLQCEVAVVAGACLQLHLQGWRVFCALNALSCFWNLLSCLEQFSFKPNFQC